MPARWALPSSPTLLVTLTCRCDRAPPSAPAAPRIPEVVNSPVPVSHPGLLRVPVPRPRSAPEASDLFPGPHLPWPSGTLPASHGWQPPASDPPEAPPLFALPPRPGSHRLTHRDTAPLPVLPAPGRYPGCERQHRLPRVRPLLAPANQKPAAGAPGPADSSLRARARWAWPPGAGRRLAGRRGSSARRVARSPCQT